MNGGAARRGSRLRMLIIGVVVALGSCATDDGPTRAAATPAQVEKAGQETIQCYVDATGASTEEVRFKFDAQTGNAEFDRPMISQQAEEAFDDCYKRLFAKPVERYQQLPEVRRRTEAQDAEFWKLKIACMMRRGHDVPKAAQTQPDPKVAQAFTESASDDWNRCGQEAGDKTRADDG